MPATMGGGAMSAAARTAAHTAVAILGLEVCSTGTGLFLLYVCPSTTLLVYLLRFYFAL